MASRRGTEWPERLVLMALCWTGTQGRYSWLEKAAEQHDEVTDA